MTNILDLEALEAAPVRPHPFPWLHVTRAFTRGDVAERLRSEFPSTGFVVTERESGNPNAKGYRTANLSLVDARGVVPEGWSRLSGLWRQLVGELCGEDYRQVLSRVAGRRLADCTVEVRAVRYGPGCWIDPHTDRADKAATQTWYFNVGWRPGWGGALRLLRGPDFGDVESELLPQLDESLVILPTERSWHAVTPVAPAAEEDRRTLLLHFVRPS